MMPEQNGRFQAADHSFKCIFFIENVQILIQISLKLLYMGLLIHH